MAEADWIVTSHEDIIDILMEFGVGGVQFGAQDQMTRYPGEVFVGVWKEDCKMAKSICSLMIPPAGCKLTVIDNG
jgi:hypothetical protein